MAKPLQAYHLAWLLAHPHRSEQWLRDRMVDGFDVHHMDGDHNNNAADNLVLIEHTDHMRLHGMTATLGRLNRSRAKRGPKRPKKSIPPSRRQYVELPDGREIQVFRHESAESVIGRHLRGELAKGRYKLGRN